MQQRWSRIRLARLSWGRMLCSSRRIAITWRSNGEPAKSTVTFRRLAMDNQCMDYGLQRPDHVPDELWTAVERHRDRLKRAVSADDRPLVVGSAKDLIECVARAVLEAK